MMVKNARKPFSGPNQSFLFKLRLISLSALILSAVLPAASWAISIDVSEAPTSDLGLTLSAIQSAQTSLYINIYDLSSPQIADAILNRIQSGVHVEILEEGQPVGGLSTAQRGIQSELAQSMTGGNHLYEMTSKAGGKRRFRYDHAKYVVVDEQTLLIGSENYSPTGNPSPGSVGNRGWEVLIHDATIASHYKDIFQSDAVTNYNDVLDLSGGRSDYSFKVSSLPPKVSALSSSTVYKSLDDVTTSFDSSFTAGLQANQIEPITSPDTSRDGLIALINAAQRSIDIEQMTFDPAWGKVGGNNPLLDAVAAAARRGVQVRVLLNDERVFDHPGHPSKPKNTVTQSTLNQIAQQESLNMSVRIANLKGMGVDYIHNKGLLIDGNLTLISSINWDENSIEHNRESAVIIDSQDIFNHYQAIFSSDWSVSENQDTNPGSAENPDDPNNGISNFSQIQSKNKLIASIDSTAAAETQVDCPSEVMINIQVGELTLKDDDDSDFKTLSNRKITGDFVRDLSQQDNCVLVQNEKIQSVSSRKFVEIRPGRNGSSSIILEGFTSKNEKLYSIRARVPAGTAYDNSFDAQVYDGSGPARDSLGNAELEFQTIA